MSGKRYYKENKEKDNLKKIAYISGIILLVTAVALIIVLSLYQNKIEADTEIAAQKMNTIETEIIESTSYSDDKQVGDEQNDIQNIAATDDTIENNNLADNTVGSNSSSEENVSNVVENVEKEIVEEEKELEFIVPLEGEIVRDYSDTNLIYSETLQEWTTHYGVDIATDSGSAVSASEDGTVKSIKNDPRYGLTITITHENGYETIYSNLLSAEFVSVSDSVKKGQTIGTVGQSAAFEIVDEPHLHFEMTLDGENVNPTTYWN